MSTELTKEEIIERLESVIDRSLSTIRNDVSLLGNINAEGKITMAKMLLGYHENVTNVINKTLINLLSEFIKNNPKQELEDIQKLIDGLDLNT